VPWGTYQSTSGWQGNRVRHDRELPIVPTLKPDGSGLNCRSGPIVSYVNFTSQSRCECRVSLMAGSHAVSWTETVLLRRSSCPAQVRQ
jgi:hypothetical protein